MTSPELTALLRASKPSAPPSLRERVRALPAADERRPARFALPLGRLRTPQLRLALVPAAAVLLLVSSAAVVGLVNSSDRPDAAALEFGRESGETKAAVESAPVTTDSAVPPATDRPQRQQAELTIRVSDEDALSRATQRALTITRSLGGYVVSSSYDAEGDEGVSYLTVRVPSDRIQDAIVRLTSLGELQAQRIGIDDLGQQTDELERRSEALTAEIARLVKELAKPGITLEERLALRTRVSDARRELADVRAQRLQTVREAREATVSLTLVTRSAGATGTPGGSRIDRTLDEAWSALLWELVAVLYAIIVLAPLALAGAGVWFAARGLRRHSDRQLLDQPGS